MIAAHGIGIEVPKGWDTEIYVRASYAAPGAPTPLRSLGEVALPVLHLASFALLPDRGDYGSGIMPVMGATDVFIALLEHSAEEAQTALFSKATLPWPLGVNTFRAERMQRTIPGFAGHQSFFSLNGRGFCLYVVVGSHHDRGALVTRANQALLGISIG